MLAPSGLPGIVSAATSREEVVRSSPVSSEPAIQRLRIPLNEGEWFTSEHFSTGRDSETTQCAGPGKRRRSGS